MKAKQLYENEVAIHKEVAVDDLDDNLTKKENVIKIAKFFEGFYYPIQRSKYICIVSEYCAVSIKNKNYF